VKSVQVRAVQQFDFSSDADEKNFPISMPFRPPDVSCAGKGGGALRVVSPQTYVAIDVSPAAPTIDASKTFCATAPLMMRRSKSPAAIM